MAELSSVERVVTEQILETGEIGLGPAEARHLGLGEHTSEVALAAGQESLAAVWIAGRRRLAGEDLAEYLQDTAVVGGLLRIERRGTGLSLRILPPGTRLAVTATRIAVTTTQPRPASAPVTGPSADRARQRRAGNRYRLRQRDEYAWRDGVGFLRDSRGHLLDALGKGGWDPAGAVRLRLDGERLATLDQFDELLAVDAAHIEHMPHQEAAARTVLARMGGRGILADEVGLGKTVEAGLVLKELILRGLARRVLIICPAPLRDQWRDELRDKFDEEFTVVATGRDPKAFRADRLIITLQLARSNAGHLSRGFDLIIIDEAHRLSGAGAQRTRDMISDLIATSPRVLFLSATPVQNNLLELYRLVELLRPGTFDSEYDFRSRFVDGRDPRRPVNAPELRRLISNVVVRTTRQQAGVDRVHRMPPLDFGVTLTAPERQLYDLLLHTLRHRMTGPADTLRRRQLALRLTASPQAVSRSALRMATREADPELRRVLKEVGHLAGDIRHTSREQTALEVVRRWIDEHGRVLVFTQHTDTLTSIMRLLDAEGITAAPFHGGMAHSQRSASVASFRSGAAPVLVSTDAGAEGQNLQVSNCVLNYDLPWNPMRVEQRIGRVHRLTQTRDVHIANLFARNTLDESVYRLLHDKLAMFELLFGQVVTVLGELGGAQDATMESRVLEALYAKSDATMQRRLDQLGAELADARERAGSMMTSDSGLSEWLAQRQEERAERAAQEQARELLPQAAGKPRRRQKDLEQFVRTFFEDAGAQVANPAEDLLTVKLPSELTATFDGYQELHLAFTSAALDHHPDAQLCVVGSDVFDDILAAQRERGDLTGSVARLPELHQRPLLAHDPGLTLVSRHAEPDADWSARATYRVQQDAASGNQELVVVDLGSPPGAGQDREPLDDGAPLPGGIPPSLVLDRVEDEAVSHLKQRLKAARDAEERHQKQAQEALVRNLEAQAEEAQRLLDADWSHANYLQVFLRKQQVERAIEAASQPRQQAPETELRAELLTLELHGSHRLVVVEQWEHVQGTRREIRYPWTGDLRDHRPLCEATGQPITTLTLCTAGHCVDVAARHHCEICDNPWCGACGPDRALAACTGCGRQGCNTCRNGGALCTDCRKPVRAAELDTAWERGWRLAADAYLLVGQRHAVHVTGDIRRVLVPDRDVDDPVRRRLRALGSRLGLPASAGLVTSLPEATSAQLTDGAAWSHTERSVWWTVHPGHGSTIDRDAAAALPDLSGPAVDGENTTGLGTLLSTLRRRTPAPAAPAVAVVPFAVVRRVDLDNGRFRYRELWHDGDQDAMTAVDITAVPEPSDHEPAPGARPVAALQIGAVDIRVDGLHRSYLCRLTDGTRSATLFVPGIDGATLRAEDQLAGFAADPYHILIRHPWRAATAKLDFSTPGAGTKVNRTRDVLTTLLDAAADGDPQTSPISTAELPEHLRDVVDHPDEPLRAALAALDRDLVPAVLGECLHVREKWRSTAGAASIEYLVGPGRPLPARAGQPVLLPPGEPLAIPTSDGTRVLREVSVDSRGHLLDARRATRCPVCADRYGPCCGDALAVRGCSSCDRPACGTCRDGDPQVAATHCERCGDTSCAACSRQLPVSGCRLCGRTVCGACDDDGRCGTCRTLTPATRAQIDDLPGQLMAGGCQVLVGTDAGATVVLLVGAHRREIAVLGAGGVLLRWQSGASDELLGLRLAAARLTGDSDADVITVPAIPGRPLPPANLPLQRTAGATFQWALVSGGTWKAGNLEPPAPGTPEIIPGETLRADLAAVVGDQMTVEALPEPMDHAAGRTIRKAARKVNAPAATTRLLARRQDTETTIAVDRRGLVRHKVIGDTVATQVADWQPGGDQASWAADGWSPVPRILLTAELDHWHAAIAVVGAFALLGVRGPGQPPAWHPIADEHIEDLHRAALGVLVAGPHTLATITAMPAGSRLDGPLISNGQLLRRQVSYHHSPARPGIALAPAADALALLTRQAPEPFTPPTGDRLEPQLATELRQLAAGHEFGQVWVGIGQHVQEMWLLSSGQTIPVEYDVPAGTVLGHLRSAVDGQPLRSAYACRAAHLSDRLDRCATCRTDTCAACHDAVRPCVLCTGNLCAGCMPGADGRCPACAGLKKVGIFGRSRFGASMTQPVWHGSGPHVEVTVRRTKEGWFLSRQEDHNQVTMPLTGEALAAVQGFLR
jgi:superfamily II DNA or RNA helicase